jgi:four helix bundle protein
MTQFRTYQLAKELFLKSKAVKLQNPYRDQFKRAMLSIPLNLAEGSAKDSNADRRRFYEIALGSLREVQAIIDLMDIESLKKDADILGANLYRLCLSLRTPPR